MTSSVIVRSNHGRCRHQRQRNREETTGTLRTRQVEDVASIIMIDGASIIVIALIPHCARITTCVSRSAPLLRDHKPSSGNRWLSRI